VVKAYDEASHYMQAVILDDIDTFNQIPAGILFLLHSIRLSSFGVSMPIKTSTKPACAIKFSNSSSSAMLIDASVE